VWAGARAQRVGWSQSPACGLEPTSAPTPHQLILSQFGRTEVIDNTLNPDFVRKFIVDYFFEEKQNLRFDL
jgi:hypothetical protein